jgi:hypothetical protein
LYRLPERRQSPEKGGLSMTVQDLLKFPELTPLHLEEGKREVDGVYIGDLLSWVMGRAEADCLWATIMNNMNVLAVASLADVALVVVCENCEISEEMTEAARQKGINLMRTEMPIYELCVAVSRVLS